MGQFLLLGSASIDLLKQMSETLAGRVAFIDLKPLTIADATAFDPQRVDRLWLRGGFPLSFLAPDDPASLAWRLDFIRTYLERDLQQFVGSVNSAVMGRLWTMLSLPK